MFDSSAGEKGRVRQKDGMFEAGLAQTPQKEMEGGQKERKKGHRMERKRGAGWLPYIGLNTTDNYFSEL